MATAAIDRDRVLIEIGHAVIELRLTAPPPEIEPDTAETGISSSDSQAAIGNVAPPPPTPITRGEDTEVQRTSRLHRATRIIEANGRSRISVYIYLLSKAYFAID